MPRFGFLLPQCATLFLLIFSRINAPAQATFRASQTATSRADSVAMQRLTAWAEGLQNGPAAQFGTVGLSVRRVVGGQPLVSYNARKSLQTASTLKLVSTATALAVLGGQYRYVTTLEYDGTVQDSTLTGNLYVRGTGDPSLGSWRFAGYPDNATLLKQFSAALRSAGIRRVRGAVVGDGSAYSDQPTPDTWPWGDVGNYYGAGLHGLNINENLYRVFFRPGKGVGQAATFLRTDPALPYLTLHNRVTTDGPGTGDQVNIYGAPFAWEQWLDGKVPVDEKEFGVKGALPDPAYSVAFALTEQLRKDGVAVSEKPTAYHIGNPRPTKIPTRTTLQTIQSPPLAELAKQTNFESINLYAEALFRTATAQLLKRNATLEQSLIAERDYWAGRGVDIAGFRPRDGSGLSASGALTPENMTSLLTAMTRDSAFADFRASTPVVGESGTVKNLARGTAAAGRVRAKSGSIEGVRAYAGYVTTRSGETLAFSVMVNKYTDGQSRALTRAFEQLFVLLAEM